MTQKTVRLLLILGVSVLMFFSFPLLALADTSDADIVRQFVVDAPGNERPVGVTVQKAHDHLMANARNGYTAVLPARPSIGDTYPAGRFVVVFAFTVPEKLYFHAAILVRVNFFVFRSSDYGCLVAPYECFEMSPSRDEASFFRDCGDKALIEQAAP